MIKSTPTGSFSRNKGKRVERTFFKALGERLADCPDIVKQLKSNLDQTRDGGEDCHLMGIFSIEVKGRNSGHGYEKAWLQQCIEQAKRHDAFPVLVVKYDRLPYEIYIPMTVIATLQAPAVDIPEHYVMITIDTFEYIIRIYANGSRY